MCMLTHGDDDDDNAWYVVYKYAWYCYRRPRALGGRYELLAAV